MIVHGQRHSVMIPGYGSTRWRQHNALEGGTIPDPGVNTRGGSLHLRYICREIIIRVWFKVALQKQKLKQ